MVRAKPGEETLAQITIHQNDVDGVYVTVQSTLDRAELAELVEVALDEIRPDFVDRADEMASFGRRRRR